MSKIIKISENLREILQKIESSSVVAKCILDSTKEGHNLPIVENGIDYLSISEADSNKISYLNCDRITSINEDDFWISGKRYHILPGKVVFKLFTKNILIDCIVSAKDIEIFSNVYRSCQIENKAKFLILKGNDIKNYYHYDKYYRNINGDLCGSLGASCMKHDRCQDYFSIFINNKEISLLCLLDNETNSLIGRALLWDIEADDKNTGKQSIKIMDRIYTTNDEFYTNMFKNWAKKNGYLNKFEQNFINSVWFEKDGKKIDLYLSIHLNTNYKFFPYLDTFKFIDINNSNLYNYPVEGVHNLKIMNSTEGGLNNGDDYCLDEITKIIYYKRDTIRLPYLNNIRVFHGNVHTSYINDLYILKQHAIYNDYLNDYIFNEEYDKFNNKEKIDLILKNKKRNLSKSIKSKAFNLNLHSEETQQLENDYFIPETNPAITSIRYNDFLADEGINDDLDILIEDNQFEDERDEIEEATRLVSSRRRRGGIISTEISIPESDINGLTSLNDVGNEEPVDITNVNSYETTNFSYLTDYMNSFSNSNRGRIYPNITPYIQEYVEQISQQESASNDENISDI
jgi:hypothetical protein